MAKDDFSLLEVAHHVTAGFKAYGTELQYKGLDEMRQACGGAGFLLSSGIADAWSDVAGLVTAEGANPVMYQQTARMLMKNARKVSQGKTPDPFFEYLTKT